MAKRGFLSIVMGRVSVIVVVALNARRTAQGCDLKSVGIRGARMHDAAL